MPTAAQQGLTCHLVSCHYRTALPQPCIATASPAGSHVGICGRTGAGKSSLLAALLRLTPIASGRITIDGTDVAALPPKTLRRAIGECMGK